MTEFNDIANHTKTHMQMEQEKRQLWGDIFLYLSDKMFMDAIRTKSALVVPTEADVEAEIAKRLATANVAIGGYIT